MPVASPIAAIPAHASTKFDPRGGVGRGKSSGQEFGEVFREQAGQTRPTVQGAQLTGANPGVPGYSGASIKDSGQAQHQIQCETPAGQVKVMDATLPELPVPSQGRGQKAASVELHAGAAALDPGVSAKDVASGPNEKQVSGNTGLSSGARVEAKTAKDGTEARKDKKNKIEAVQPGAEKLLIPHAAAPLLARAAVPLIAVSPAGQKAPKVYATPFAKSAISGGAKAQTNTTQAVQPKTAAAKGVPMPEMHVEGSASVAQGIQSGVQPGIDSRVQTGVAGASASPDAKASANPPDSKSGGKQEVSAAVARAALAMAQHSDSGAPAATHQVAPAAGDAAAHLSIPSQGSAAGVSGPAAAAASLIASPYDRIDQGSAPIVLHSGAQQVSVGVHDPHLGWVEIQTQSAAGHVDATLLAASGQTHDSLAAQLPAISQFLEQRDVRVGTLAVHHQNAGGGTGFNSGSGSGSGGGSGSGFGSGQGYGSGGAGAGYSGNSGSGAGRYSGVSPGRYRSAPVAGLGAAEDAPPLRRLSYISVRA